MAFIKSTPKELRELYINEFNNLFDSFSKTNEDFKTMRMREKMAFCEFAFVKVVTPKVVKLIQSVPINSLKELSEIGVAIKVMCDSAKEAKLTYLKKTAS